MKPKNTCIISAGELSGDQHAALMVQSLKQLCAHTQFVGYGGGELKSVGVELIGDYRQSGGIMGFGDVFKKLGSIYKVYQDMKVAIATKKPSLVILIDYADFNMRLAKIAYSNKIPVLYFIPPKVWAWRKYRITDLKRHCSVIASIFPFETEYLINKSVAQVRYVGHPFCDEDIFKQNRNEVRRHLCNNLKLDPAKPIVSVLVGSRKSEVTRHLPIVIEAVKHLLSRIPDLQFVFVKAKSINEFGLPENFSRNAVITDIDSRTAMMGSDVGIIKSGTSTLEAAFAELPFVCIYQAPKLSEVLLKIFCSLESYSLPNLVYPGSVVELVQEDCSAENISNEVVNLLNASNSAAVVSSLKKVKSLLSQSQNSYRNVAELAAQYLNNDLSNGSHA